MSDRSVVRGPDVDVLLADGRIATVRRVEPTDLAALVELHESVGEAALHFRFFSANRATARTYAQSLCRRATTEDLIALVAVVSGRVVAVASAEPLKEEGVAEASFLVADDAHGLGIGTLLLEHLAAAARNRGVGSLTAEVLADNHPMLRVFKDAGFSYERELEFGVVVLTLDTTATARAVAAADARECRAEARSLEPLLYPRSVAVVGVRRDGSGVGRAVLDSVRSGGFTGPVYVVHPTAAEVAGIKAHASLSAIGEPVDLVIVAVPAEQVLDVVRDATRAGVRAAAVLSAGFSEEGPEGAARQREVATLARRHSLRLVGPNCLGVIANDPSVRLNATFTRRLPPPGRLAVASQSGGVGIAMIDLGRESGLGIAQFVSLGNKADVSGNDLLAAWLEDDRVGAAALYLESFGNARKFARIARRFSERKPLLAVVGGRSDSGARAGASHTAAAAAPSVGVDALFAQSGVIGCPGLTSLADTARLLAHQPLPAGPRVAVVGNAGGLGVLAADTAAVTGLVVPDLSSTLREQLSTAATDNPVDLGAAADSTTMLSATTTLLGSDEVDAVLLIVAGTSAAQPGGCLLGLQEARARSAVKPLLLVAVGDVDVPADTDGAWARFRSVEEAMAALGRVTSYAAWRAAPTGTLVAQVHGATERARSAAVSALSDAPESGWIGFDAARELLVCSGVELVGELATSADAAAEAAERLGFPVVAKVADPDVVHKTDRGLVRTGLLTVDDVRRAVTDFGRELGDARPPVLVQPQVAGGVEVAVGVVRDPGFGPLVMVAAGGVATDVWDDRVFLMPPLTDADAARAIRRLRIWPLLAGFRGAPPVDVAGLERLVLQVGSLAVDVPHVAELDLNPVLVSPSGISCVDAKVRLAEPAGTDDAGVPRHLRPIG